PFQRKRYWVEDSRSKIVDRRSWMVDRERQSITNDPQSTSHHPLLEQCLQSPLIKETICASHVSAALFPYLEDHKIHDLLVFPLTGHLEIILAAARHAFATAALSLEEVVMHEPLLVPEKAERALQLVFQPTENGASAFQLISLETKNAATQREHKVHVSGTVVFAATGAVVAQKDLSQLRARCTEELSCEAFYLNLHERGLQFGPQFHGIRQLSRREGEAVGHIVLPEELHAEAGEYYMHPALLDACLQVFGAAWPRASNEADDATFLPLRVESYRFYQPARAELWSHVTMRENENRNAETYLGEVAVYNGEGNLVAELKGLLLKRTTAAALQRVLRNNVEEWFCETVWRKQPLLATASPAQLIHAAQALLPVVRAEKDLAAYEELLPQLDQLCANYVLLALQQLGGSFSPGQRFTLPALMIQLGLLEKYRRLLERMLAMLAEENILQRDAEAWVVVHAPAMANPQALAATLLQKYPASKTELQLTIVCGTALAAVLCGKQDPLHLLFPGGSVEFLEQLYQHSPLTQAMNRLAAAALHEAVAQFPRERKLRVLEVGAGTGGTTAFVLPVLRAANAEYVFTDVSPLFLAKAKEKFRDYGFVQYHTLDIERAPRTQNFSGHEFDIVLATNALHATADLRQTLRHVQELLREDGLLLLI
ncbi:MAG: polyketide synthase dehydratase domain-containing protein, partial [candidate division KSB1 bacterium]